jgi:hypothetical protein
MGTTDKICVVVAWHSEEQIARFLDAWDLPISEMAKPEIDWLVLQRDREREGCAVTKNRGVREAVRRGADIVVVLDDDCFPVMLESNHVFPRGRGTEHHLRCFAEKHAEALEPQAVEMLLPVTKPISRGTPYRERTVNLPVAASMGFWTDVGDYDACGQLVHGQVNGNEVSGATPETTRVTRVLPEMEYKREAMFGRYFSLCGMNLAFRAKDWLPWCQFIDVPRFDDIWMGWLWQREAYRRGYCFNLNGPLVRHSRQSNVWKNLQLEAVHLERNETLWQDIALHAKGDYDSLRKLLPV